MRISKDTWRDQTEDIKTALLDYGSECMEQGDMDSLIDLTKAISDALHWMHIYMSEIAKDNKSMEGTK